MTGALDQLERDRFAHDGVERAVWRGGSGPGVVVVHEIPGITPAVAGFARRLIQAGFTVALPVLAGEPGKRASAPYVAKISTQMCVSREFHCLALRRTSPVAGWLRAVARDLHQRCGGPGVGAVGMCFTGGFSLAMAVDPSVIAPVVSQPSLPLAVTPARRHDVGLSPDDADVVRRRARAGECAVLGLRFTHDRLVPSERFDALRRLLGDAFTAVEIDSGPGNPHRIRRVAHSVLAEDLVDEPGHPTRAALEQVIDLFRERLQ